MAPTVLPFRFGVAWLATRATRSERGASIVEYALLVVFVAVVCVLAVEFFGASTGGSMSRSNGSLFSS